MIVSNPMTQFDNFVFAGGGTRCFWQAGFWQAAAPKLNFRPQIIGAVSAGSAIACMIQMNRIEETIEEFKSATRMNAKNAYPENLLLKQPIFPQAVIYKRALVNALTPSNFRKLQEGAEIRILSSRVPRPLGPKTGTLVGFASYVLEKNLRQPMHPAFARRIGFKAEIKSVQSCRSPQELIELILASSSTPPFTPVGEKDGRPVLDGGLIDNVPVETLDGTPGSTLVLLTRQYDPRIIPQSPNRIYVQPSRPIPISKWDYTSPQKIQATFNLGRLDGHAFASRQLKMAS